MINAHNSFRVDDTHISIGHFKNINVLHLSNDESRSTDVKGLVLVQDFTHVLNYKTAVQTQVTEHHASTKQNFIR